MDILTRLDQLRLTFHECQAVAYADLGARMILVTSTAIDLPQERWDDLCHTGFALLTGAPSEEASRVMRNEDTVSHALVLEGQELGLFLRSQSNGEDVLLCVSSPSLPINEFMEKAGVVLDGIAQDG